MPALVVGDAGPGRAALPEPQGIMAARSKEITSRSLADLGLEAAGVGGAVATTKVTRLAAASGTRRDRGGARSGRRVGQARLVDFLASRRII